MRKIKYIALLLVYMFSTTIVGCVYIKGDGFKLDLAVLIPSGCSHYTESYEVSNSKWEEFHAGFVADNELIVDFNIQKNSGTPFFYIDITLQYDDYDEVLRITRDIIRFFLSDEGYPVLIRFGRTRFSERPTIVIQFDEDIEQPKAFTKFESSSFDDLGDGFRGYNTWRMNRKIEFETIPPEGIIIDFKNME